jgi:1-hydroxycarotenoid 3,4-desaturase
MRQASPSFPAGAPRTPRVTVIGAGMAGLAAAIELAARGIAVTVLERAATPGGKARRARVTGGAIDAGPTVFTMPWVFEQLFATAGTTLSARLTLKKLDILARHAWSAGERLDLFSDPRRTEDAIGVFAGPGEAAGFRAFRERAERVYRTLEGPFMRSQRPTAFSLTAGAGLKGISEMWGVSPFATLWKAIGEHFRDPRLRQLFGRYATYSGSSPLQSPATLMLIAHVEEMGVWAIDGGMARLIEVVAGLAEDLGVTIRTNAHVREIVIRDRRAAAVVLADGERIESDGIVCNADFAALSAGLFGAAVNRAVPVAKPAGRSLSAVTWCMTATTDGFPLTHHNVFFSRDYKAEFDDIFRRARLPGEPTVYVCAQDRDDTARPPPEGPERLLVLVNAPANGGERDFTQSEIDRCATRTFDLLTRCGLSVERRPGAVETMTPAGFARLFPATGGALYGQAVHGALSAFRRPGARSAIKGLYLAGGSVHPGPGMPMAALSGRLAAESLLADLTSR